MSTQTTFSLLGLVTGRTNILLNVGFGAILIFFLLLVGVGLSFMYTAQLRINAIVETHNVKTALLNEMYTSARERSLLMHTMLDTEDPFQRDEYFLEFNRHGGRFAQARIKLLTMPLSEREKVLLSEQGKFTGIAVPIQDRVIDLIQAEKMKQARDLLNSESVPAQNTVLDRLLALQHYQETSAQEAARQSDIELKAAFYQTVFLGIIAIVVSTLIAIFVIRRTTRTEQELQLAKQLAETTLYSIGDAVITTDRNNRVASLNTVAELLTGWTNEDAKGHPLESIFTLFEEGTQGEIINPIAEAVSANKIIHSGNNIYLGSSAGRKYAIEYTASPIRDKNSIVHGGILSFRDVTEVRSLAAQLSYQASHDTLTGLVNRSEFEIRLRQTLSNARAEHQEYVLCYMDLDQFKVINDTCGHAAGDELLKQIAARLKLLIRDSDTLARLGGDEFGVLLDGCSLEKAREIADKLLATVREIRFAWDNKTFEVGASIGVVPINELSGDLSAVMSAADTACYEAKEQGRNRIHVFDEKDINLLRRRGEMDWVHRINDALENDKLTLYCQPIFSLDSTGNRCIGYEILVRLKGQNGEIYPPNAFIPAAERYNLMPMIDKYIVSKTIMLLEYQNSAIDNIFINISGQSVCDKSFVDFLLDKLENSNINPGCLTFEITETATVANFSIATQFIDSLKDKGCHFALDDFGSGLSSFSYLKNIPVDYLKIDGSFIRDIANDKTDYAFVKSIQQIGSIMGLKTIAEFVESESICDMLGKIGIDYAQGFYLGKPRPVEEVISFDERMISQ